MFTLYLFTSLPRLGAERVWCTKFFSLLLKIYFHLWVSVLAPTYLFPRRSQKVFTLQDWHKTYPVCDVPLLRSARHSFASSQKSLCQNRSCLWTEALFGKIFVAVQRPSLVLHWIAFFQSYLTALFFLFSIVFFDSCSSCLLVWTGICCQTVIDIRSEHQR